MINLNKALKYIFCAFVFVFPFFFVPQSNVSQILNQKLLLVIFSGALFFIFAIKVFIDRRIVFKDSWISRAVLILWAVSAVSTLLSKNVALSFWGGIDQADSLLFLSIGALLYFLSVNVFSRRDVVNILESFIGGTAILSVLYLIQDFTKISLSLFGDLQAASIVVSLGFVVLISFIFNNTQYFKRSNNTFEIAKAVSAGFFFFLFLAVIFLMNFRLSWLFVSIGTFFVFWRSAIENDFNLKSRRMVLSLALMLVFLSFLFIFGQTSSISSSDARISYADSLNIVAKTAGESVKDFLVGSGPSTYAYQFSLYKNDDLNRLGLGSLIFNQASIPFFTFLTTSGLLGTASLLAVVAIFYFRAFPYFLNFKKREKDRSINVNDIIFPVVFSSSLLLFFYKINPTSLLLASIPLGLWVGQQKSDEKSIEISSVSKKVLEIFFVIFFAVILIVIINFISFYRSKILYEKSIANYRNGGEVSLSISEMEKAAQLWKDGDNYISLSQLYIIEASDDFSSVSNDSAQMENIRNLALKAEGIAKFASVSDPENFQSWQNLGLIYENTDLMTDDRIDDAIAAYAKAESLAPHNEDIYMAEGRLLESKGDYPGALQKYRKVFELDPLNSSAGRKVKELEAK
jgi:tetratricopeptide (TPR) repeat protein